MKVRIASRLLTLKRAPSRRALRDALSGVLLLALSTTAGASNDQPIDLALGALQRNDYAGAAAILEHLAAAGDAKAQAALATLLESGDAKLDTSHTPLELLRTAAAQDLAPAALELGNRYFLGQEVPRDLKQASEWWQRAAQNGSARAAFNLGLAYAKGDGITRDDARAGQWFVVAAERGIARAWFALGIVQLRAGKQTQNYAAACASFAHAARADIASAFYNLGTMYEHGISCEVNIETAIESYRTAAQAGISKADAALERLKVSPTPSVNDGIKTLPWIEAQSPAHFTLQVASGNSEASIRQILHEFDDSFERAYVTIQADSGVRYLALIGSYVHYVDALAALNALGADKLARKPWIRRFSSIRVRAGN